MWSIYAQVQLKIFACYPNARVKCNCGVAVRVGSDVYVIDVCNGSLSMGYKLCGDNVLTTMKENDFTYTVSSYSIVMIFVNTPFSKWLFSQRYSTMKLLLWREKIFCKNKVLILSI